MLLDPFNRSRLPADFDRAGRVRLLGEAAQALLAGEMPSDQARVFLAGGLLAWLETGGHLTRDFWKTCGAQGSRHTESHLWRADKCSSRRATAAGPDVNMGCITDQPITDKEPT